MDFKPFPRKLCRDLEELDAIQGLEDCAKQRLLSSLGCNTSRGNVFPGVSSGKYPESRKMGRENTVKLKLKAFFKNITQSCDFKHKIQNETKLL